MKALITTTDTRRMTGLFRAARSFGLLLLLVLPSFTSVAQDSLTARQEALVSIELPPLFVSDFMRETTVALGSVPVPVSDESDYMEAVDIRTAVAVPVADVAWIFAAGLIGFILLSNRRSV